MVVAHIRQVSCRPSDQIRLFVHNSVFCCFSAIQKSHLKVNTASVGVYTIRDQRSRTMGAQNSFDSIDLSHIAASDDFVALAPAANSRR